MDRGSVTWKLGSALLVLTLLTTACGQAAPAAPTQPAAAPSPPQAAATKPAAVSPAQPAAAAKVDYPTMTLKGAHEFVPGQIMSMGVDRFAKNMSSMSDGKVNVEVFDRGSLVSSKNELEAISKGTVDFTFIGIIYHPTEFPFLNEVSLFPFLFNYKTMPVLNQKQQPMIDQEFAKFNAKVIAHYPSALGLFFRKPIDPKKPDFTGIKMRSSGGTVTKMLQQFGASTVSIPSSEIPVALRTGLMDGLSSAYFSWEALGIQQDVPYGIYSGEIISFTMLWVVNKDRYAQLPPVVQRLIDKAALESQEWIYENVQQMEAAVIKKATSNPKIQVHQLSSDEVPIWRQKMQPVVDDLVKRYGDRATEFIRYADQARAEATR